jgi:UDP-glucuronate 4-epimerase
MRPNKILITGVAGFIGSNLANYLLSSENYYVIGLDNFDDFYPKKQKYYNLKKLLANNNFLFIESDICNIDTVNEISNIDVIIHLAGKAGVRPSIQNPLIYQDVNLIGTQILLEYAKKRNIKQFIFASSSSVYGINKNFPWKEDEQLYPISPYASSKLSCEMLGHVYSHLYDLRFLALRFFTVYGPGQRPDLAIHNFFKSILNDEPITVYGNGSSSRDYTYIDDIISGIVAAIHYKKTNFEIINLGNNQTNQLDNLINSIEFICEKKAIIHRLPDQLGDVKKTCADITKAKDLLNYQPNINLEDGLLNFYKWYCVYMNEKDV